jgi:hypothetical protein
MDCAQQNFQLILRRIKMSGKEVAKHSSERADAVVDAKKLEAMFVGDIYHVVYEVHDFS